MAIAYRPFGYCCRAQSIQGNKSTGRKRSRESFAQTNRLKSSRVRKPPPPPRPRFLADKGEHFTKSLAGNESLKCRVGHSLDLIIADVGSTANSQHAEKKRRKNNLDSDEEAK